MTLAFLLLRMQKTSFCVVLLQIMQFLFFSVAFCIAFHEKYENYYLYNDLMRYSAKSVAMAASRLIGGDLRCSDRAG